MKKLTASIVASALMISAMGINAFAADTATATPKITVYGNESSPVAAGEAATFIVRLSDFSEVKGMDLTISSKDGKVEFTDAAMDKAVSLVKDSNVKVEPTKIHIVDLTSADMQTAGYANITVKAKVNGADTINVTGKLAKNGKETINAKYNVGTAAVKTAKEIKTEAGETVTASDKAHFIPYGFIEDADGKYVIKEKDGSFKNVPTEQKYAEFEVPENGITTFAYSTHDTENAIQFGTYTNNASDNNTRGTLLIEGNWEDFKNYYITEKGFSVNDILKKVNDAYDTQLALNPGIDGITLPAGSVKVTVRRLEQTKAMWAVKSEGLLQYAARLTNAVQETTYTAVGYLKDNSTKAVTFSENVVTTTYKAQ